MMIQELNCKNICFERQTKGGSKRIILDDVSAAFSSASITLISGATGAGKSTLLHILAGMLRPLQGEVLADSHAVSRWNSNFRDRWRRAIGIIFQHPKLLGGLTVLENIILPMVPHGIKFKEMRNRGYSALERLQASHLVNDRVAALSGGERQRVCAARALASRPKLLIADEPTSHQDPDGVLIILNCLLEEKERGAIVIVAAHDSRLLQQESFADQHYRLQNGRLEGVV